MTRTAAAGPARLPTPTVQIPGSPAGNAPKSAAHRVSRPTGLWGGTRTPAGGYLPVWSSISASAALRLTDSMPLTALALLS